MNFDLGYLVVLGAVVVILMIYRQLDKNNRSLEKIRKFAETVRNDLNSFVEERTASIKDFETVLKVHDKTAGEILRRIQGVEENLLTRVPEIEALQVRLDQYGASLKELEALSGRVDDNLGRLKEESEFVDKVGRRIKLATEQMTALENAFVQIRQEFQAINQKDLEAVKAKTLEVFDKETLTYVAQLQQANKKVEEFHAFVDSLDAQKDDFVERSNRALEESFDRLLAQTDEKIERTAAQAETLSLDVLKKMDEKIASLAQQSEDKLRAEIKTAHQNVHGAVEDLHKVMESVRTDVSVARTENEEELSSVRALVTNAHDEIRSDLESEKRSVAQELQELKKTFDQIHAQFKAELEDERLHVDSAFQSLQKTWKAAEGDLNQEVKAQREKLRQEYAEAQTQILALSATLKSDLEGQIQAVNDDARSRVERFAQETQSKVALVEQETQSKIAAWTNAVETNVAAMTKETNARITTVKNDVESQSSALRDEVVKTLDSDRKAAAALVNEVKLALSAARQDTQEHERKLVSALESRIKDYEASFAYRFQKMEEVEKDVALLDQNLRLAMERAATRVQADFEAFDQQMHQRREDEKSALEERIETTRLSMTALEKDLEDLKARAYDNVSEKLQGFEEEFFQDLQKRNASMQQSFDDWQAGITSQLDSIRSQSERERLELERSYNDQLRLRVQDLQTATGAGFDKLERQVADAQERFAEQVKTMHESAEATRAAMKDELSSLEKSIQARFEQGLAKQEIETQDAVNHLARDVEARIKLISDNVEMSRGEIDSILAGTQSELGIWQNKYNQKFKELENDLGDQYRNFKQALSEKIAAVTEEFNAQKDDILAKSIEERAALKSELSNLRRDVDELENTLKLKTETALEAFQRDWDGFYQDLQKKNRELGTDIENKLKDYRASVQDVREKSEALQKKIFARIEDQANLLSVNVEEIDKKQKAFVSQTKIFERADTLKQELQEAIEDLKTDLAKLEVQRKELFEIEGQVTRVKKMGDEASEKLTRFIAEKKRIDLMDADFQKIIAQSQAMELRLEQVASSNDLLQEIQYKIRKLEDYSKDVEVKFDRLEKRREVLDTTTDGVDRNFSLLEKMEKTAKTIAGELSALPGEVEELKKRIKVLSQGKDDAERAVEKLTSLDQILKDIETRMNKMDQTRDWLTQTENRLQEVNQAAEEQVKTLATLTRGTPTSTSAKAKASINADMRQTVLKLARQGWGKEEIARATKLSMGEVELILELGPR